MNPTKSSGRIQLSRKVFKFEKEIAGIQELIDSPYWHLLNSEAQNRWRRQLHELEAQLHNLLLLFPETPSSGDLAGEHKGEKK